MALLRIQSRAKYYHNVFGCVRDLNDVVVSHYLQLGDIIKWVSSRYPPLEEKHQTSGELQDSYQNKLARHASNGRSIGYSPSSGNSSAEQHNGFFEYQNCKTFDTQKILAMMAVTCLSYSLKIVSMR